VNRPRGAALIALLSRGGLRRSEVVALNLSDYAPENGAVTHRHGKAAKTGQPIWTGGGRRACGW
jgi:integrase